jgi:hypothetical protein
VRRELVHRALDLATELVLGDERDEVEGLVKRLGRQLAAPPAAPALVPDLLGLNGFLDGHRDGPLQLSFAAPAPRPLRRQFEAALVELAGLISPLLAFRFLHRLPAPGASHRVPGGENPTHSGHRFASDQAVLVEKPLVLPVELLEGVIR